MIDFFRHFLPQENLEATLVGHSLSDHVRIIGGMSLNYEQVERAVNRGLEQYAERMLVAKRAEKLELADAQKLNEACKVIQLQWPKKLPVMFCGDVHIDFRLGNIKYDILRKLRADSRLSQELNDRGSIRVVAGSLSDLSTSKGSVKRCMKKSFTLICPN